jgi:hypothetical protein
MLRRLQKRNLSLVAGACTAGSLYFDGLARPRPFGGTAMSRLIHTVAGCAAMLKLTMIQQDANGTWHAHV